MSSASTTTRAASSSVRTRPGLESQAGVGHARQPPSPPSISTSAIVRRSQPSFAATGPPSCSSSTPRSRRMTGQRASRSPTSTPTPSAPSTCSRRIAARRRRHVHVHLDEQARVGIGDAGRELGTGQSETRSWGSSPRARRTNKATVLRLTGELVRASVREPRRLAGHAKAPADHLGPSRRTGLRTVHSSGARRPKQPPIHQQRIQPPREVRMLEFDVHRALV